MSDREPMFDEKGNVIDEGNGPVASQFKALQPKGGLPEPGTSMTRLDTGLFQAVQCLPPRDLERFEKNVLWEAAQMGEKAFYTWEIETKYGKKMLPPGPSIGLAMRMLAHYTKATVISDLVKEDSQHVTISSTFVDLESGVTFNRMFKQRKEMDMGSRMDKERARDIAFQIGQSKSIRNAIIAAMPPHLIKKCIDRADAGEVDNINKIGIVKSRNKALDVLSRLGITKERVTAKFDKPIEELNARDLVDIKGMVNAIKDGQVDPLGLFPEVAPTAEPKKDTKPRAAKAPKDDKPIKTDEQTRGYMEAIKGSHAESTLFPDDRKTPESRLDYLIKMFGQKTVRTEMDKFPTPWKELKPDARLNVLNDIITELSKDGTAGELFGGEK